MTDAVTSRRADPSRRRKGWAAYGKASFDFAQNKPIELIDGANLLYLLSEHTGIEAKIVPPAGWKDPAADTPD